MNTEIKINGIDVQSEWVHSIEDRMSRGPFSRTAIEDAAWLKGCPLQCNLAMKLADKCIKTWLKRGRIIRVKRGVYCIATPAETEAHNLKMKGGVAK